MTSTILPPAPRTRTARLLEGEHRWGRLEESSALFTARTGVCTRRLVVYAPGADAGDRRILTLWRSWPAVGGGLAFAVALGLAPVAPVAALAGMLAVYVGGLLLVARRSRRARSGCRSVKCSRVQLATGWESVGDEEALEEAVAELTLLERLRDSGRIGEIGFELGWARVHDRLGTRR
ncbi:DUF6611 family protein [Leifsonia sp. NPDC058194]|uniref:DUF6611 family protein n=1 Tax=Leifsonia sp. NPDC058194 TaxID=3346374 RepID=UPI0036DEB7C7